MEKTRTFRWRARHRAVGRRICWTRCGHALAAVQGTREDTYIMGVDTTGRESVREASTYSWSQLTNGEERAKHVAYHREGHQNRPITDQRSSPNYHTRARKSALRQASISKYSHNCKFLHARHKGRKITEITTCEHVSNASRRSRVVGYTHL